MYTKEKPETANDLRQDVNTAYVIKGGSDLQREKIRDNLFRSSTCNFFTFKEDEKIAVYKTIKPLTITHQEVIKAAGETPVCNGFQDCDAFTMFSSNRERPKYGIIDLKKNNDFQYSW